MEVKPGYRQTSAGPLPVDWAMVPLGASLVGRPRYGINAAAVPFSDRLPTYIRITDISPEGQFAPSEAVSVDAVGADDYFLSEGDIVFARTGATVGKSYRYRSEDGQLVFAGFLIRVRTDPDRLRPDYLAAYVTTGPYWSWVRLMSMRSGQPGINGNEYAQLPVPNPPLPEQRAIATAASDVDALLGGLERLIAKKRDLKQAAMQQLLTGETRLPGFRGAWEVKRIADVALPSSEKNTAGENLPVLACSKHFGFMDSLGFFKNQVFSKDLSTYKVIRRDEIGYPANHVEEGSIGLQDLYDAALVSPIYVVFRVTEDVSSFFLHRLLKLDSYRQRFKTATTSSVDRRGSLRWPAFSEISVGLPPTKTEQTAIAAVLSDMDSELSALEARREKTRDLKRAMMQELLTGKTRLVPAGGSRA